MTLLGGLKRGLIFVVSAPAGTGKTTLVRMLTEEFPCVVESVSFTTRKMRPKEVEGKDYHFIADSVFEEKIAKGEFLEHARVFGHYYGTSKRAVEKELEKGRHVALVIDTQGAMQLKTLIKAIYIFICPPDLEELKKRLHGRKSDTDEAIETRLSWARKELETAKEYDYLIINEDLQTAYKILRSICIAEEHRSLF